MIGNPVLRKELLCGLRSPAAFLVMFGYGVLVTLLIIPVWPPEGMRTSEFQTRSAELFQFFTLGQFVVIGLLAPAVAATGFASEKERRVYDLIYTSPLDLPRIILGKLVAAILFLLLLISSSLPAMSVCFRLGGISGTEVIFAYSFLLAAAVASGLVALLVSAHCDRSATALMVSYLIVLPIVIVVAAVAQINRFFFTGASVPVLIFVLAWLSVIVFMSILSALKKPYNPVGVGLEDERTDDHSRVLFDRTQFPENLLAPPRKDDLIADGANPIYEKELRSEIFGRGTQFIRMIVLMGLFVSIAPIYWIFTGEPHVYIHYMIGFALLVTPAFSAGAFTLERERGTMDMILATPLPSWKFVLGKALAVGRFTSILTALLTVPLLEWVILGDKTLHGYVSGSPRLSILVALGSYGLVIVATIALSCAVAMAISMTARTTVEALLKSYVFLLALFGGTFLVHAVLLRYQGSGLAGVPAQPAFVPLVFAGLLILAVAMVCVRSLRLRRVSGIPRNLLALMPLILAGSVVAFMCQWLARDARLGQSWENLLGVFSPFLAVIEVSQHLWSSGSSDFDLPSAFCYVLFASLFAIAILISIGLRWRQVVYEERD